MSISCCSLDPGRWPGICSLASGDGVSGVSLSALRGASHSWTPILWWAGVETKRGCVCVCRKGRHSQQVEGGNKNLYDQKKKSDHVM